ncbi:unnamed protein product [Schistocephalus solidus]|uniref:Uncharacterized protein n=1 Tax=Schistocephalus solidus TaxID=70667 RepID=A0A183SQI6_SCHSO|nr:unnamed protein product [Schistocephalus solidus]
MLSWLLEAGFCPATTPRTTVTIGGLNQVRFSGFVYASTPGISDAQSCQLHPVKKSYDKSQILKHRAEQFRSVINCSSKISDTAIDRVPQVDTNNDLDLPPSLPETIRAVQQISIGEALGSDAIPPEVYKHGGLWLRAEITTLFQEMWHQGKNS